MPTTPTPAQSQASRLNGARSAGPATPEGKARSSLNGVRHGLCGRTFFLLADEDPEEFRQHEAMRLAVWSPRDLHEHEAAEAAIRAMWREIRADRLEAQVLTSRIEREHRQAMDALDALRQRRLARSPAPRPSEPGNAMPTAAPTEPSSAGAPGFARVANNSTPPTEAAAPHRTAAQPPEPEPRHPLNRRQHRALAAMARRAA